MDIKHTASGELANGRVTSENRNIQTESGAGRFRNEVGKLKKSNKAPEIVQIYCT